MRGSIIYSLYFYPGGSLRISIHELTQAISGMPTPLSGSHRVELLPRYYLNSPSESFADDIVQSHRQRGISPELFLGLFKYYRRAYYDCVQESSWEPGDKTWCLDWLGIFFDQMEIAILPIGMYLRLK
jgi:hypothetical protein